MNTPVKTADRNMTNNVLNVPGVRFADAQLSTGVRIHYAEWGNPAGETIVFLHGVTDSWFSFSPVLDHLSPRYHVYMLDQRGHGNSDKPETGYAVADFAADVIAFMEALSLPQVTLIGHSMGSFVAQRIAVKAPERVKRLVLIDSATDPFTEDLNGFLVAVNELTDPVPDAFVEEFQVSTIYGALKDGFLEDVISESKKLPALVWKSALNELVIGDAVSPVEQIAAPTLILWGDHDAIWPRTEQEALAQRIPNGELRVYPETGHALHWERPEHFAHDLDSFISLTTLNPLNQQP